MRWPFKIFSVLIVAINLSLIVYVLSGQLHISCDARSSGAHQSFALIGNPLSQVVRSGAVRDEGSNGARQAYDLMKRVYEIHLETLGKVEDPGGVKEGVESDGHLRQPSAGSPRGINGTIPGRQIPGECNAEAHSDYDGVAVTWGLTHPQESAADCCQACLDQARSAQPGEKKCNIWVYCPAKEGCYSPDIYVHEQFECWLKQADAPRHNFKGEYSVEYRRNHPTCPVVVPWASGVISTA